MPELAASNSGGGSLVPLLLPLLIIAAFFFLLVRPQRQRQRQVQQTQASLLVGQEVVTTGGLFGTVAQIGDDTVDLEVSPGVRLRFAKAAIARTVVAPQPPTGPSSTDLPPDDRPPS